MAIKLTTKNVTGEAAESKSPSKLSRDHFRNYHHSPGRLTRPRV